MRLVYVVWLKYVRSHKADEHGAKRQQERRDGHPLEGDHHTNDNLKYKEKLLKT